MQHLLKIPQTQKSYEIQTQSRQWFKVERDPENLDKDGHSSLV